MRVLRVATWRATTMRAMAFVPSSISPTPKYFSGPVPSRYVSIRAAASIPMTPPTTKARTMSRALRWLPCKCSSS